MFSGTTVKPFSWQSIRFESHVHERGHDVSIWHFKLVWCELQFKALFEMSLKTSSCSGSPGKVHFVSSAKFAWASNQFESQVSWQLQISLLLWIRRMLSFSGWSSDPFSMHWISLLSICKLFKFLSEWKRSLTIDLSLLKLRSLF